MIVAPIMHGVQVGVFKTFGYGQVQARLISVVLSILTLIPFFLSLRRAFGDRVATTATVVLGLDHTNLLFNRMALLDTPATFLVVCTFYAFVRATTSHGNPGNANVPDTGSSVWLALCGFLLGVTIVSRPLCAYLLPAPLVASWLCGTRTVELTPGCAD